MEELSMQDVQQASLEVLKKVADICEKEKIRYALAYGTLLGAIRHKGFIPWDDDIDIIVPRPDYERLLDYFAKNDTSPFVAMNMQTTKEYPYLITRIADTRYRLEVQNENDYGLGTFIDVYVLDGVGNTYEEGCKYIAKTCKYPRLIFLATRKYYHFGTTKGFWKRMIKFPAFCFAKLMGKKFFIKRLMKIVDTNSYEKCKFVGCAIWNERPFWGVFDKKFVEDTVLTPFEDGMFRVPKDYDEVLRLWYGDYMKLPPEKDRIYHHLYKVYKK
jgi:lipopolysaccharide cholinephosphotransferase